jgi:GH24 family phage-related lysozyme (muramidase)
MTVLDRMIHLEEGREHAAYPDPLTKAEPWTIGEGHTGPEVHEGLIWTDAQIDAAKADDLDRARRSCVSHFSPWFGQLDEVRQAVLIAMAFQMGLPRLLGFVHFLGAMRDQRWNAAAGEMRDSAWYRQTHNRAERCARAIETGETQWG